MEKESAGYGGHFNYFLHAEYAGHVRHVSE